MSSLRYVFALALVFTSSLRADEPAGPIELVIEPRGIDDAARQSRLLPAEAEIMKGDAAPILLRLPWEQRQWMNEHFDKLADWEELPLDSPKWQSSNGVLPANFYREMKRAAYRQNAAWEYPIGEDRPLYLILLPDVQGLHTFLGHGLTARARYHLSQGELAQAQEVILVGLADSRHLAQTPFLINQIVAVSIQKSMFSRVEELIAQPGSPNLYWALTKLPHSLLEMDRTASLEGSGFLMTFPAAKDLDRPRELAEWRRMADQLVDLLLQMGMIPRQQPEPTSAIGKVVNAIAPPTGIHRTSFVVHGRRELPGLLGISESEVAKMSDEEVGVRWYAARRIALDQKIESLLSLGPCEAWPQAVRLREEVKSFRDQTNSEDQFFEPVDAYISLHLVQRKIQALRIIEAVRDFASKHEGQFPNALSDIQDLPIPRDPFTDEPFLWTVADGVATLSTPPLPIKFEGAGEAESKAAIAYRLRLTK